MKVTLLIIGILAVIIVACVLLFNYERNFFTFNGVGHMSPYEDVVARFGEPNEIILPNNGWRGSIVHYDGITFTFSYISNRQGRVMSAQIADPEIRFGWRRVGVGSTRQEVEHAHRSERLFLARTGEDNSIVITNGIEQLWFRFDENDLVYSMNLFIGEVDRQTGGFFWWWDRLWE